VCGTVKLILKNLLQTAGYFYSLNSAIFICCQFWWSANHSVS